MEAGWGFRNSVGIWIGWSISVLAMIIRVDMITTHMVIIVLKAIYRGWVWHLANILALIILALVNILLAALNIEFWVLSPWSWYYTTPPAIYSDSGSSGQSSQPIGSHPQTYYYPYGNYIPDLYTYRGDDDNDDFVLPRNSMWKWLYWQVLMNYFVQFTILCMYFDLSTDDACSYAFTLYFEC